MDERKSEKCVCSFVVSYRSGLLQLSAVASIMCHTHAPSEQPVWFSLLKLCYYYYIILYYIL